MTTPELLVLSPCAWQLRPGVRCGQAPAGVDMTRGVCLCAEHLKVLQSRAGAAGLPSVDDLIEGTYEWLRRTWHPPYDHAE